MNLNKIKKKIKEIIKYYFFSDFIKDLYRKKKFHPNPQANWIGDILKKEVPIEDTSLFRNLFKEIQSLSVNGITKIFGIIYDLL